MKYAKLVTPQRTLLIPTELANFGAPLEMLFGQTEVSGYDVWRAYSHNNFDNPFRKADEERFDEVNGCRRHYWAESFRDRIAGSCGKNDKGKVRLDYISHADTEYANLHDVWAPKEGWIVPTGDGIFQEETLIPYETVDPTHKEEAKSRWERAGLPPEQVSYFWGYDDYNVGDEKKLFVNRAFFPNRGDDGRFSVAFIVSPQKRTDIYQSLASRPRYEESEIIMEMKDSAKAV